MNESITKTISDYYQDFNEFNHVSATKIVFTELLNTSPVTIPSFALIEAILFNDSRGALFFTGTLFNLLIYYIVQIITRRRTDFASCQLFNKINTSGIPSIHTQTIGFLIGFILTMNHIKGNFRILALLFCIFIFIVTLLYRLKLPCNGKSGIIIGFILGGLFGGLWAWAISPYYTPPGVASDVDFKKFNKSCKNKDDDKPDKKNYICKAYKNGKEINTTY